MNFPTEISLIWDRVDKINPIEYNSTRNYKNGAVSYLSPYISRGIISTKQIIERLKEKGFNSYEYAKFEQELAWREFWQRFWQVKGDLIYTDLKHQQSPIKHHNSPTFLNTDTSGIEVIDEEIAQLKSSGYMHNHMRMYLASIVCNVGQYHWKSPADWMYYHLLDGDVASNYLSWQWVAGTNSNKKYIANQDNINNFFESNQKGTFLDTSYESLQELVDGDGIDFQSESLELEIELPEADEFELKTDSIKLYNYYNLDPFWRKEDNATPILLLEPSKFQKHPVSKKNIDFVLDFNTENLQAKVFVGEFEELILKHQPKKVYFKEHPLNKDYQGTEDSRDWMFDDPEKYSSFFAFWKKVKKLKK